MCRFLIYQSSEPIRLENLLTRPAHSIINQSFDSRLRIDMRRPINGDGFGVGYYPQDMSPDEEKGPCVYCSTTPAWNSLNLARLASKTKSRLVFAHVRASTAGVLSETNCHPFVYHTLMFMHNGGIPLYDLIKIKICLHIQNKYFIFVQGSTDSEMCFALFLDTLDKLGVDPANIQGNFDPQALRIALAKTIEYLKDWFNDVAEESGGGEPSLLNFAVTDGTSVVVSRYVSSQTEEAASLYYSTGTRFYEYAPHQYKMERYYRNNHICMIASEPLTFERNDWIAIPTNTIVVIGANHTVLMYPIIDEYYAVDSITRSNQLTLQKGLASPLVVNNAGGGVPPLGRETRMPSIAL